MGVLTKLVVAKVAEVGEGKETSAVRGGWGDGGGRGGGGLLLALDTSREVWLPWGGGVFSVIFVGGGRVSWESSRRDCVV